MDSVQSNESSVLFNLRQLMQLESERVQAEAAAQRERVVAREREREALARAQIEAARRESWEAAEREREREQALLRVQLEVATDERVRREHEQLQHARELRAIEARALRMRALVVALGLSVTLIGAVAVHAWWSAPRVVRVESRAPIATPSHEQTLEIERLREQIAKLNASRELEAPTSASPSMAPAKAPVTIKRTRVRIRERRAEADDGLGSIDKNDGDPLGGL